MRAARLNTHPRVTTSVSPPYSWAFHKTDMRQVAYTSGYYYRMVATLANWPGSGLWAPTVPLVRFEVCSAYDGSTNRAMWVYLNNAGTENGGELPDELHNILGSSTWKWNVRCNGVESGFNTDAYSLYDGTASHAIDGAIHADYGPFTSSETNRWAHAVQTYTMLEGIWNDTFGSGATAWLDLARVS